MLGGWRGIGILRGRGGGFRGGIGRGRDGRDGDGIGDEGGGWGWVYYCFCFFCVVLVLFFFWCQFEDILTGVEDVGIFSVLLWPCHGICNGSDITRMPLFIDTNKDEIPLLKLLTSN